MTNPPGYPAEFAQRSRQRAEDLRKELPREREKPAASFLWNLSQCYLNPPENQRHYRPHILLISQVVEPESFHYFLHLPRELRDLIYFYALRPPRNKELAVKTSIEGKYYKPIWESEIPLVPLGYGNPDSWSGRKEMASLLTVNRQVYGEASEILFSDFRFSIHARVLQIPECNFIHKLRETVSCKIHKLGLKLDVFWHSKGIPVLDLYCYESLSIFPAVRSVDFHFTFNSSKSHFGKSHGPVWPIERIEPMLKMFGHVQISFSWSSDLSAQPKQIKQTCKIIQSMIDRFGRPEKTLISWNPYNNFM
ncbi:hypothetical protein AJ78_07916 [Emergomyces pasteurianus Ep9510]|uniref:F-box domain-containing protein n=1 Tax=Emergomyces pasteurianus Ep9510 TaxID=1447872 RepID=A0A1J9Q7Y0_9EURO|nr:hypothetical protein AJ78_07916 [Emergomyces pasteurianus Ep9510]